MNPITRGNIGAQFRKADLHVHTPGSYDYKEKALTREELIDAFIDEGLELVVVADHNCTGWFEDLRAEAKERQEPIEILPGAEITTPQGGNNQIHLVAVFPPDKVNQIQRLLGKIEVDSNQPSSTQASHRIPDICDEIQERGGLAILAHIDDHSGAHTETGPGNIREKIFDVDRVAAIEVVCPSSRHEYPDFLAVSSSDAHSPDELGRGYTYLKMTQPSFEGLQTAFSDPESRIRFSKPEYSHGHIAGVRFDGDFLNQREIQASPNLNCLIGGKGTGKSTIIEQIRFAFDIDPKADRIKEDYQELIEETLGEDGEVEVHIKTNTGDEYAVSRKLGESPRILRADGTDTEIGVDTFKSQFLNLEIHSQGELLELARDTADQLDLLDSYLDFEGEKGAREELKNELRTNAQNLQATQQKIDRLESEIKEHEAIKENLEVMKESGVEDMLNSQEAWDQEQTQFGILEDTLVELRKKVPNQDELPETPDRDFEETPNQELLDTAKESLDEAQSAVSERITQIYKRLDEAEETIDKNISEWEERNNERQAEYRSVADEIEEETGVDINEYFELKENLANSTNYERSERVQSSVSKKSKENGENSSAS